MSKTIILVIGASSDIGIELIKNIDEDALILAHYNTTNERLIDLNKEIDNEVIPLKADLSAEDELVNLIDLIEEKYGVPEKIVHLAASKFQNIRFKDISWNEYQREFDISLKSIILILTRFLPKLAKQRKGKVVLMLSSVTLNVPPKALSVYTTTKYALLGLLKSLASEYADKNIQINGISPSMIDTKFLDSINEKLVELNAYNHPLKRNAKSSDVIPVIKLLLSNENSYINGVNIPITGGDIF